MTRNQILDAAARIISQKGYHAASMQDIARAVNLQKASLYHHVSSKQEILLILLNRGLDLLTERLEAVVEKEISPDEKLRQAMTTYMQTLADYDSLSAILLLEHRSLEPELHELHVPRRDRFERIWRDLIQEGIEAGVFTSASPSIAARAVLGVMNWTITWYRYDGPLSAGEIAAKFADLFLQGLLVRPSTNASTHSASFQ
jgi:AcrR family transcriptional regulator